MCGRYWLPDEEDIEEYRKLLAAICRGEADWHELLKRSGEVFPGDRAPCVIATPSGGRAVMAAEWGFRLSNGKRVINARGETAPITPMFRPLAHGGRCLVPAAGYYEWAVLESGRKRRYTHRPSDHGLMWMAGLHRATAPSGSSAYVVLTKNAVGPAREIHDRMPLLLRGEQCARWLHQDAWPGELMEEAGMELAVKAAK